MEPDDDNEPTSSQPNASATSLIILGVLGILVIVGFLYTTMTR